jgi:hypothetical protein
MLNQNVLDNAKGLTVLDLKGEIVDFDSLWKDRRIILTFFRHFG